MTEADVATLLATGERAAFHGAPGAAVEPLTQALAATTAAGRVAEASAAAWLLGVSLGACARYSEAFDVLNPLLANEPTTPELRLFAGLAAATVGSLHRQLGRHADARAVDERGLALVEPLGEAATDALVDCTVGLAADAIGLGDLEEAQRWLARAEEHVANKGDASWRPLVRIGWTRAEVAMLGDDHASAVAAVEEAISRAERARAPRHVAKGLLFLGVAQAQAGDAASAGTLRRAATLAESLGAQALTWSARALLGAVLASSDDEASLAESDRSLATARSIVLSIASGLRDDLRADWLARPDTAALLGG